MIVEISIHVAAVHALRKSILDGWVFFHPPNGELREGPRALAKLMAMGMLPGLPDLVVISPEGKVHFMEFKSANGALDPAQQNFQMWAIRAKLPHSVCRSVDEAVRVFEFWKCVASKETAHGAQS